MINVVESMPGANWVAGMIMLWSGSLAEIGVGNLAGWALCDGGNGTPDLRDRFVIGAGNKPVGNKNTPANFNTNDAGSHIHVNQGTAITLAQMPSHSHSVSGSCSGNTGLESQAHNHSTTIPYGNVTAETGGGGLAGSLSTLTSYNNQNHYHAFSGSISGTAAAAGSGATHTHAMESAGVHNHVVQASLVREVIPYYALAYIMKL